MISEGSGFSKASPKHQQKQQQQQQQLDRSRFLQRNAETLFVASAAAFSSIVVNNQPVLASTTVSENPSSYSEKYFSDAMEILISQRIACDNIISVIADGNLEEAGFKAMRLNSQVSGAGRMIMLTIQKESKDSIGIVRYLKCQQKFATLLELCNEDTAQIQKALRGEMGALAVAQIQLMTVLNDTILSFDDFLRELSFAISEEIELPQN